jgi:zinc protease
MGGGADHYKARLSRVASATADDLRSSARRWLKPDGVYVLEVRPFAEGKAAAAGADRARLPEPGPPPAPRFPAFERARLANGLEIVLAPRHAAPLVTLRMMLGAGYAADHGGKPGTAALAGDLLDEGTLTRSSLEIAAELARLGATLATASDVDTTNVTLSAVKASLGPSLELFADVILRPSFPQGEVDRIKKEQIARIQREKVSPVPMALRVLPRLIYGADHPYGNPFTGSGMEAVVETLTREELARFHATWFKPGNATLVVAGDVTLDEVRPKLEALFGGWKPGEVPRRDIARVGTRPASEVYVLDRPGALQSVIIAGQVAPPKANPQEIAIEAMNTVLGGQFISRVNMNLREGKHWSYGAFTLIPDARGQRPFIAYAPVQTDKTKESLLEVLKELKGIRGEAPVTPEELKIAQDSQTLALPGRWETNAAVVADLAQMVRFGLGDQYYATYPEKVRALSVADVNKAAELVEPDRLVWVVVGDRAKIESGVTELALGPVRVIDADGNVRE